MILIVVLVTLFGLAAGAATAHIAEGALAGRRLSTPRCPYCTTPYTTWQWSAAASTLVSQVRCRTCDRLLRTPRIVGEVFLAAGWALLVARYGFSPQVVLSMVALIPLTMILVTDLEAKRVPNVIMLPSVAVMVVVGTLWGLALPWLGSARWWQSLAGGAVGFITFRVLIWIGVALFGEGALGEGDMTLAAYVGAAVGFPVVFMSLLLAFLLGGLGALMVIIIRRGGLKSAIPYGPFIILGCAITLIWGPEILAWFLG